MVHKTQDEDNPDTFGTQDTGRRQTRDTFGTQDTGRRQTRDTLGTQDTGRRQTKQKTQRRKLRKDEQHIKIFNTVNRSYFKLTSIKY